MFLCLINLVAIFVQVLRFLNNLTMTKYIGILYFILFFSATTFAQDDPTLFTVEGKEVGLSEFQYIYEKNNGDKADYSKESLDEYLELYTKFKLKVQRAKEMGLDTVAVLQTELEGYRQQLANSYLTDKEVTGRLMDEVAERMQTDVRVSHIFIANPKKGDKGNAKARETLDQLFIQLQQGKNFADLAKQHSQDEASAKNGGALGFYSAPLPSGFYNFENAMYSTEVGKSSKPFETKMGWHIIQVEEKRPALGERELSHILIRSKVKGEEVPNAKERADSIYQVIKAGADFSDIAKQHSDDANTSAKGGYLGFVKINQFDKAFEKAAFALAEDGDVSSPVESKFGYHIVQRKSSIDQSDIETNKKRVKSKLSKDDRLSIAKKSLIEKIKKDAGIKENKAVLNEFITKLGQDFYSYKWKVPPMQDKELVSFNNNMSFTNNDFANYCKKNTRSRLKFSKDKVIGAAALELYDSYLDEIAIKYEESNLEKKYPDFKALMREYEEGILLFEATKMEVWDKATEDTIGLKQYYENNTSNYNWEERAEVETYQIQNRDAKTMKKIIKSLAKWDSEKLMNKYNVGDEKVIEVSSKTIEKSSKAAKGLTWKKGATSAPDESNRSFTTIQKISKLYPPKAKSFDEARGYIIADYQDYLEREWVKSLKSKYSLEVNQEVFDSLIKK